MNGMVDRARNRGQRAGRRWGTRAAALAAAMAGAAALGAAIAAPAARADDAGQAARAVRLSDVSGQVQIAANGQPIATQAAANMPLFEGYQISTGQDGRAEIQFEDGSVARIAPDSALTLSVLRGQGANGNAVVVLNGGLGYFELEGSYQAGQISVQFGNAVVTAGGFTVMRVDMDTPPGTLAVFSGNAHMEDGDALTLDLHGGESVALNADNPSQSSVAESIDPNSWDQWNSDRDQALQASASNQTQATDSFVNSTNPAWSDLNSNGNWYNVPGQGYIWSPYVAANAGWDPYGCGQWMWTPRYGYIWVSCNTWGFMPYQCGTWNFYDSFGWGWSPGMGGCNPWWGGGGYGGPNIGYAPAGYRPVIHPPMGRGPIRGPHPVIAVNRMAAGGESGTPLRSRSGPVTIAGHTVEPLETEAARSTVQRTAFGSAFRASPVQGMAGQTHPGPSTGKGMDRRRGLRERRLFSSRDGVKRSRAATTHRRRAARLLPAAATQAAAKAVRRAATPAAVAEVAVHRIAVVVVAVVDRIAAPDTN